MSLWRWLLKGRPAGPPPVHVLDAYRWPTDDRPLATTSVRLDVLAARCGAVPQTWDEPGLGTARGFAVRLAGTRAGADAGGLVVLLVETFCAGIPPEDVALHVDASDLATRDVADLLADVLPPLGLARADLTWVVDASVREDAARIVAVARQRAERRRREP